MYVYVCVCARSQGPGRELRADDKDFVTYLYKLLARIGAPERRAEVVAHGSAYTLQAVSCIQVRTRPCGAHTHTRRLCGQAHPVHSPQRLFLRRREFAEERVAALVKRLATTALALPPNRALAVMSCIRCAGGSPSFPLAFWVPRVTPVPSRSPDAAVP